MAKAGRPYHHGELKEALVSAGRKLLEEKGLRGFTLRECARRASRDARDDGRLGGPSAGGVTACGTRASRIRTPSTRMTLCVRSSS